MTKFIFAIPLLFVFLFLGFSRSKTNDNSEITICHSTGVVEMQAFALDPAFQNFHPKPNSIAFEGLGTMTTFKTDDGATASGYLIKAKKKSKKWLFVYQEWWGLNDHIKKEAEKFYTDLNGAVNVIAMDMYDGKVATEPKDAGKYMSEAKEPRLNSIMKGAYALAGKKAKVANVGWCFGGSLSLKSALIGGKNNVGSVIYYGMPVRDVEQLKTLNSDVLGLFATETRISKEVIEDFAAKMKLAGKNLDYTIYEGVHGFANPSNPKHDPTATANAYGKAITYIKTKLL
jgi:carboxymethylenebutenolidase